MRKTIFGLMLLAALLLVPVFAAAQSVTMTTAQKVQLTANAVDASNGPVQIPQTGVAVVWSSNCPTCTFTGGTYDVSAKVWTVFFNAGTDLGTFTVTLRVTYNGTAQVFTSTLPVTINEVIVIPAAVKIVPGTPIAK